MNNNNNANRPMRDSYGNLLPGNTQSRPANPSQTRQTNQAPVSRPVGTNQYAPSTTNQVRPSQSQYGTPTNQYAPATTNQYPTSQRTTNSYVPAQGQLRPSTTARPTAYPVRDVVTQAPRELVREGQRSGNVVERAPRASYLKDVRTGASYLVDERIYEGEVTVTEKRLEEIVTQGRKPAENRYVNTVELEEEEPVIVEKIVEKIVDVIVERKVAVERVVEVPYDVYIERPVEKLIEREQIIEKIMERPIERIMEVPVEVIYEIPVERIVEIPVEVERIVEVPYETIVERKIEQVHENLIYNDNYQEVDVADMHMFPHAHDRLPTEVRTVQTDRYVDRPVYIDNIIEKTVEIPIERIVERPIERIVEIPIERIVERPIYIDNIVERQFEVPVERIVEQPVERLVPVPVYYDNIINNPVPVERIVERVVEVEVEQIVNKTVYIDNIVHAPPRTREVEVPYEKEVEVAVEETVENYIDINEYTEQPRERIVERPIAVPQNTSVPVEFVIEKDVFVPKENAINVEVARIVAKKVNKEIFAPSYVERITEVPVPIEKIVEVPIKRIIEVAKYVEREEIREIPIEKEIVRRIERIVENRVEVPVEQIIECPVRIITERPVPNERHESKNIDYTATRVEAVQGRDIDEGKKEHEDPELAREIERNIMELERILSETQRLQGQHVLSRGVVGKGKGIAFGPVEKENLQLRSKLSELESRHSVVDQDRERLMRKSQSNSGKNKTFNVTVEDPQVDPLRKEIKALIQENKQLVDQLKRKR